MHGFQFTVVNEYNWEAANKSVQVIIFSKCCKYASSLKSVVLAQIVQWLAYINWMDTSTGRGCSVAGIYKLDGYKHWPWLFSGWHI